MEYVSLLQKYLSWTKSWGNDSQLKTVEISPYGIPKFKSTVTVAHQCAFLWKSNLQHATLSYAGSLLLVQRGKNFPKNLFTSYQDVKNKGIGYTTNSKAKRSIWMYSQERIL